MAMLAGPRKRQKFSIDPRGSFWSKDENKFGKKMLERMGWSQGRGLGAKEDGRVEHIKIAHKDDNRGVGCSKSHADNWIAHQDDFNSLLANLNQNYAGSGESGQAEDGDKVMSLEKKSKAAKSRVHYQKFTKGKDLSSRKLEDLDCIFGRRKHKKPSKQQEDSPAVIETEEEKNKTFGVQTFQSEDSMQGYFAKKMAKLESGKNSQVNSTSEELSTEDEEKTDSKETDSSLGSLQTFNSNQSVQDYFAQKMAKFKLSSQEKQTLPVKNAEDSKETSSLSDPNCTTENVSKEEKDTVTDSGSKKKKQKKRKREKDESVECESISEPAKKKKRKKGEKNVGLEEVSAEQEAGDFVDKNSRRKAKKDEKRRRRETELLTNDMTETEFTSVIPCNTKVAETSVVSESNDTPRRKSVSFRDPIISILGEENQDLNGSVDCGKAFDKQNTSEPCDKDISSAADMSDTTDQTELTSENVSGKKKKNSKKRKKDTETVSVADSCILENATNTSELNTSTNSDQVGEHGKKSKKRNRKGKEAPSDSSSTESLRTPTEKPSPPKSPQNLNWIDPKLAAELPAKFVGSNINKIPGYSRSKQTLSVSL